MLRIRRDGPLCLALTPSQARPTIGTVQHERGGGSVVRFTSGDLFTSDAEALVNAVNCVGVMGRGVALQFKNRFPANFAAYAAACGRGEVRAGRMFVHETGQPSGPRLIVNFPTKRHWRDRSRMEDIEAGLAALAEEIRTRRIRSVALPALGSGLGGLPWPEVRGRIEAALGGLDDVRVLAYEPGAATGDGVGQSVPPPPRPVAG